MLKTKGSGTGGLKLKKSAKRRKEKTQQVYCLLGFFFVLVREGGLDPPCGAGRLAALERPRRSIHSRSPSNPQRKIFK